MHTVKFLAGRYHVGIIVTMVDEQGKQFTDFHFVFSSPKKVVAFAVCSLLNGGDGSVNVELSNSLNTVK